jgi:D-3-phosphoglycerate dehydrogenase / 2-oxoglutarate reductase
MAWKILISAPYFQPVVEEFRHIFEENDIEIEVPSVNERLSEAELLAIIEDIDGVISGDDQFTEEVLKKGKKLKVISKWGTGIDSIDQEAAARLGIAVKNTPNAFTQPVSDTVLGYILCFARQLPWMDNDIRQGKWSKRMGVSLRECTLGIIGVGNIGKAVARKAKGFGMQIVGTDIITIPNDFIEETGLHVVGREELLQRADFVSLNCTLNPTSYHIIDSDALKLMKATAYVINTARGPLIDETAVVEALEEQRIAGVAMDVFETEPLSTDNPLRQFSNCLLAPHNSNSSPEAWQRVHRNTMDNLLEELRGSSQ